MEDVCFLRGPRREVISEAKFEAWSVDCEFCTGVCEGGTQAGGREEWPLLEPLSGNF
jgi:hypothetical protein